MNESQRADKILGSYKMNRRNLEMSNNIVVLEDSDIKDGEWRGSAYILYSNHPSFEPGTVIPFDLYRGVQLSFRRALEDEYTFTQIKPDNTPPVTVLKPISQDAGRSNASIDKSITVLYDPSIFRS